MKDRSVVAESAILGLAVTASAALLSTVVFGRIPHIQDAVAHLFQARIFATGRLWAPVRRRGSFSTTRIGSMTGAHTPSTRPGTRSSSSRSSGSRTRSTRVTGRWRRFSLSDGPDPSVHGAGLRPAGPGPRRRESGAEGREEGGGGRGGRRRGRSRALRPVQLGNDGRPARPGLHPPLRPVPRDRVREGRMGTAPHDFGRDPQRVGGPRRPGWPGTSRPSRRTSGA